VHDIEQFPPKVTREACALCGIKHLSQSRALMKEQYKGYPLSIYFTYGHMAEAEDELLERMPVEANRIRDERIKLQEDHTYKVPFANLMLVIAEAAMLPEFEKLSWRARLVIFLECHTDFIGGFRIGIIAVIIVAIVKLLARAL